MSLQVKVERESEKYTALAVRGPMDYGNIDPLLKYVELDFDEDSRCLILDLGGVGRIDSVGLGALVGISLKTREGKGLRLAQLSNSVDYAVQKSKLTNSFDIYDSLDDAVIDLEEPERDGPVMAYKPKPLEPKSIVGERYKIEQRTEEGYMIMALSGKLDIIAQSNIKRCFRDILESDYSKAIIDLSGIDTIGMSFIGSLLIFLRGINEKEGHAKFVVPEHSYVMKTFRLVTFDRTFEIYHSLREALGKQLLK